MDRLVRVLNQEEAEQAHARASEEFRHELRAHIIRELRRGVHTLYVKRLEAEMKLLDGESKSWS